MIAAAPARFDVIIHEPARRWIRVRLFNEQHTPAHVSLVSKEQARAMARELRAEGFDGFWYDVLTLTRAECVDLAQLLEYAADVMP